MHGMELWTCHLGQIDYREAVTLQERLRERVQARELPATNDIAVVETDRGGKLTYHGPGQLVGYPIMHVPNVRAFVETMEAALITALRDAGVPAALRDGRDYTGVWVQDRKIASIGVHLSCGVTTHGFAVNVENDLQPFEWVVACGLDGVRMTSLIKETGRGAGQLHCFRKRAAWQVAKALGRRQRLTGLAQLESRLGVLTPQ